MVYTLARKMNIMCVLGGGGGGGGGEQHRLLGPWQSRIWRRPHWVQKEWYVFETYCSCLTEEPSTLHE
jgi:hypothetical protein